MGEGKFTRLEDVPEGPLDRFPEVLYVVDSSEDYDLEPGDERIFTAGESADDLVGYEQEVEVGVYKLVAVKRVIKQGTLEILESTPADDFVEVVFVDED